MIRDVARVGDSTVSFIGIFAGMVISFLPTPRLVFPLHLVACAGIAWMYSLVFRSARRSGVGIGLQLGLIHWAIAGVAMAFSQHGVFVHRDGPKAMLTYLISHLVFGAIVGFFFDRAAVGFDHPRPIGPVRKSQRDSSSSHRLSGTIRV